MCLAVAEIGDRLATTEMGRKLEGALPPFLGKASWVLIQHNVATIVAY